MSLPCRTTLLVGLVVAVVGCSGMEESSAEDPGAAANDGTGGGDDNELYATSNLPGWTTFATGIAERTGTGDGVFIAYGGYGATVLHVEAWVDALKSARLEALGLGHLFAVKGPKEAGYDSQELPNSKIAARLRTALANTPRIVIVAHSSGAYVAHELLRQLSTSGLLQRVSYFDLDGGYSGLNHTIVDALAAMRFVYAREPGIGFSRNASAMKTAAATYKNDGATTIEVDATGAGCSNYNCLHDTVITSRPHRTSSFDVADDYTDFSGRHVVTVWLGELQ
jgi:hypothetical protein